MAIVSLEKKFIFICNGKTGTTSIEHHLQQFADLHSLNGGSPGLWANKHMPAAVLRALLPEEIWRSCFKFVFVRHPLDWFTSQHAYNLTHRRAAAAGSARRGRARRLLGALPRRLAPSPSAAAAPAAAPTARRRYTVRDVEDLHAHLHRYRGMPLAPSLYQSSYVCSADGEVIIDFIGRFETLAADFDTINRRLGFAFTLPHLNRTTHLPPAEAFEPEAEARVRELWAVDFATLGYD